MLPTKMRRYVGFNKIKRLVTANKNNIGLKGGITSAEIDLNYLSKKYGDSLQKIEEIDNYVNKKGGVLI